MEITSYLELLKKQRRLMTQLFRIRDCVLSGTNSTMSPILQPRQMQIFLSASTDTSSPFLSLVIVLEERPDTL